MKSYNWIMTESGSCSDGSCVTIFYERTVKEMKNIIKKKALIIKTTDPTYDYGTETIKDIEERYDNNTKELLSLYGYTVSEDNHVDIEAHRMDKIHTVTKNTTKEKTK